ncbi:hypothetical protein [Streptomyces lutosisoli]|uniref:DUF2384 domain-containing protein n=1 Tax=Streptomyces lutosisoli TaxID=2665721 RepID=A0ABW2VU08_9ACTN
MPVPVLHSTGSKWAEPVDPLAHTGHTTIRFFDVPEIIREVPAGEVEQEPLRAISVRVDLGALPATGGTARLESTTAWPSSSVAPEAKPVPFAYACVVDLARWLEVGKRDLLQRVGIPRPTFYSWAERGSVPRSGTTRHLFKVHSLALLVVDTFGEKGARQWFHAGLPTNRELFLDSAGDREALERLAELVQRAVVPTRMPKVDRGLAARVGGEGTVMPDTVLEGW